MVLASQANRGRGSRRLARAHVALVAAASACVFASVTTPIAHAKAFSAPATLQMFEATWRTMENRAPDILKAGYGGLWTPPPQRADSGNQSVGYDVYDRFDLGS